MEHLLNATGFGHGDQIGRRSDPPRFDASLVPSMDRHPTRTSFTNDTKITGTLELSRTNGTFQRNISNTGSVVLSNETSTNRLISPVPICSNNPTNYLYTFGDGVGALSKLTERAASHNAIDEQTVSAYGPNRLIRPTPDKYEYVSDFDSENREPVNGGQSLPVDQYCGSGVHNSLSAAYNINTDAFRPIAETDKVNIWSHIPTSFPYLLVSTSVQSENVAQCTKTYRLQDSARITYNGEFGLPGKSGRVLYNGVDRNPSPNTNVISKYKDTSGTPVILGEHSQNSKYFNIEQVNGTTRNETICNETPLVIDARHCTQAQRPALKSDPFVLSENQSPNRETREIVQSVTGEDHNTVFGDSSGAATSIRRTNDDVCAPSANLCVTKSKKTHQSVPPVEHQATDAREYLRNKPLSVSKYKNCENGPATASSFNPQQVPNNSVRVADNKSVTPSGKSFDCKGKRSNTGREVFKRNPSRLPFSRDKRFHVVKTKPRATAVDCKPAADGASRKHLPALSERKTKRKLNVPQRSAAQKDPYFRGATVWLQTIYKDGRSSLQISAFYSNVKVRTPRARRGYSRVRGLIPEAYSCSETEDNSLQHGRLYSPCGLVKTCASCRTRRTPLWRDAEDGTPLCNACGIRYKKYHLRCSKCWNIPKKDIKTYPNCPVCGASLRYSFQRKTW